MSHYDVPERRMAEEDFRIAPSDELEDSEEILDALEELRQRAQQSEVA